MADIAAGPFTSLVSWLVQGGFVVLGDTRDDERFGNSLLLLRRAATRIRVVRDRSQWFMEIAAPGSDEWFGPAVWLAALDGRMPPLHALSADEQEQVIQDRLSEIDQLSADGSGGTLDLLRSWQAQRAAARQGQPPVS